MGAATDGGLPPTGPGLARRPVHERVESRWAGTSWATGSVTTSLRTACAIQSACGGTDGATLGSSLPDAAPSRERDDILQFSR